MAEVTPIDKEETIAYVDLSMEKTDASKLKKIASHGVLAVEGCGSRYRYILKTQEQRQDWKTGIGSQIQRPMTCF